MKTYLLNPKKRKKLELFLYDGIVVLLVFLSTYILRIILYEGGGFYEIGGRISWLVILGVIFHLISFYVFGLYEKESNANRILILINIFLSVVVAGSGVGLLSFAFPKYKIGRLLIGTHLVLMVFVVFLWRVLYKKKRHTINKNVVLVGWSDILKKIIENELLTNSGYKLQCLVADPKQEIPVGITKIIPINNSLESALQNPDLNTIVCAAFNKNLGVLKNYLVDIKFEGIEIFDAKTFYEHISGKVPVTEISRGWLLFSGNKSTFQPPIYLKLKRILDVIISSIILLPTLPLCVVIAFLIKLDSKGPVFLRQERLGMHERPFILLKFRTMINNAEKECGPCWACEDDNRFTRIGKFLRKTRLDEIPQFINVFKGDMSLVGPRPIREHFAKIFSVKFPFYRLRFKVKPGISGWAQVNMTYVNTMEDQYEKLEYEMYYIYHQSIFLDLFIILKTVQSILKMNGG